MRSKAENRMRKKRLERISKKLWYYRKLNNLSQTEVAQILGINKDTYSYKEKKVGMITIEEVLILESLYSRKVIKDIFFTD